MGPRATPVAGFRVHAPFKEKKCFPPGSLAGIKDRPSFGLQEATTIVKGIKLSREG